MLMLMLMLMADADATGVGWLALIFNCSHPVRPPLRHHHRPAGRGVRWNPRGCTHHGQS
jgi:hypothetical protein